MDFHAFMYVTIGRRHELERGMAGQDPILYRRMLDEIAEYARVCEASGFAGIGIPEHQLQIEGFELGQDPGLMVMFLGQHAPRIRINQFGYSCLRTIRAGSPSTRPPSIISSPDGSTWRSFAATRRGGSRTSPPSPASRPPGPGTGSPTKTG